MNPGRIWLRRGELRLVMLLALVIGMAGLSPQGLVVLLAGLALWASWQQAWAELSGRIFRLRWFYLAIFLLYLSGPGPLAAAWPEALFRVGILVAIVLTVSLLLRGLPATELGAALARLLVPLRVLSFPVDRFSLRLAGTLDAVGAMDQRLRTLRETDPRPGFAALAQLCLQAEEHSLPSGTALQPGPAASARESLAGGAGLALIVSLQWL